MTLNILQTDSTYIYQLLKLLETHTFRNDVEICPLTIEIPFAHMHVTDENELYVCLYDYYDENGNVAELDIEDFYDFYENYKVDHDSISYNGKTYTLYPVSEKKTPK